VQLKEAQVLRRCPIGRATEPDSEIAHGTDIAALGLGLELADAVEWARAIAGPRPSKNRTCELAPHPAQAWSKHLSQGAGTRLSRAESFLLAIRNGR
jgi:hypothetical protein